MESKKSRKRPLKVYLCTVYPGPDVMKALGAGNVQSNNRMASAFVAARSVKEGAALMGTGVGSSDRIGGARLYQGKSDDVTEACMAKPGQVFVTKYMRDRERKMVEMGIDLAEKWPRLVMGVESTLETGEALLAGAAAKKSAAKAEDERRAKEREDREERRSQTSQVIAETIERIQPALEALGINSQTVVAGKGAGSNYERQGILLPAETAERLIQMALELDEVMGS